MSGSNADKKEIKFFANLFLDSEMSENPLEGQGFFSAILHLHVFLQALKEQEIQEDYMLQLLNLEQKDKDKLSTSAASPSTTTLDSKSLTQLGEDIQFLEKAEKELYFSPHSTAMATVDRLIKRGYVFLPGGWSHFGGGAHAMIYQFVIDTENNRLLFLVSNSGSGLQYHPKSLSEKSAKILYENQIAYQIPLDKLLPTDRALASIEVDQRKKLIAFTQELLQARSSGISKDKDGAQYVYEVLFEKIKSLGGERIAAELLPERYKPKLITAQRSGTCTQKALNQLIKNYFPIRKDHKAFIYAYKLYSLKAYIHYLKENDLYKDPAHRKLLIKAIKNLQRALKKLKLEKLHHEKIQILLDGYLTELNIPPITPAEKKQEKAASPPALSFRFNHLHRPYQSYPEPWNRVPVETTELDLLAGLEVILSNPHCDQIESIKRLCIQQLITKSKEEKIDVIDQKIKPQERLLHLAKILEYTDELSQRFQGPPTPQSTVVRLSLFSLCLKELDSSELNSSSPLGASLPALIDKAKDLLETIKKTPQLKSGLTEFDLLLENIEKNLEVRIKLKTEREATDDKKQADQNPKFLAILEKCNKLFYDLLDFRIPAKKNGSDKSLSPVEFLKEKAFSLIQKKEYSTEILNQLIKLKLEIAKLATTLPLAKRTLEEIEFEEHLQAKINDLFLKHPREVAKLLPALVQEIYPELKPKITSAIALNDQPLIYQLRGENQTHPIDLASGALITGHRYIKPLPLSIRGSSKYHRLIDMDFTTWFDTRDSFYYFKLGHNHYRISDNRSDMNSFVLQRQIEGEWYSREDTHPKSLKNLFKKSNDEKYFYQIHEGLTSFEVPRLYQQSRYRWYFSGENAYIYDEEKEVLTYRYLNKQLVALDPKNPFEPIGIVDFSSKRNTWLAPFLKWESEEFIEVLKTEYGHCLRLPRYDLTFESSTDPSDIQCLWQNKKHKLLLDSPLKPEFYGFDGYLLIQAVEEKNDENPSPITVLIPFQPFIFERDKDGARRQQGLHYALIQDHKAELKKDFFGKAIPHWHYNGSERSMAFTLLPNGDLQANSSADQLYLAYICLAKGHPEKAYALLEKIELSGNTAEIESAFFLLEYLPAPISERQLNTPMNLAVQNRLLWMLVKLNKSIKKPIELSAPKTSIFEDDQDTYVAHRHKQLINLSKNLDKYIARQYSLYLGTLGNIPKSYQLNPDQERELLEYYVNGHAVFMGSLEKEKTLETADAPQKASTQEEKKAELKEPEQKILTAKPEAALSNIPKNITADDLLRARLAYLQKNPEQEEQETGEEQQMDVSLNIEARSTSSAAVQPPPPTLRTPSQAKEERNAKTFAYFLGGSVVSMGIWMLGMALFGFSLGLAAMVAMTAAGLLLIIVPLALATYRIIQNKTIPKTVAFEGTKSNEGAASFTASSTLRSSPYVLHPVKPNLAPQPKPSPCETSKLHSKHS